MNQEMQQSLILIKPDAVDRSLIGEIITRFEKAGLTIVGLKLLKATPELARSHYGDFVERYTPKLGADKANQIMDEMAGFLSSGPLVAMVVAGVEGVANVRRLVGSTYPNEAAPGTIRGDLAHVSQNYANSHNTTVKNLVHASGNPEEAQIEIGIWFKREELTDYEPLHAKHTWR